MPFGHNPRTIYLVDPRFQVHLMLRMLSVVALGIVITIVNGAVFCYLTGICSALPTSGDVLTSLSALSAIYLALLFVLCFGGLAVVCLLIAHRIAGPVYKIQKYIFDDESTLSGAMALRRGDYLVDLAETMYEAAEIRKSRRDELQQSFVELRAELKGIEGSNHKLTILADNVSQKMTQLV
jgi:hypothetical protein